MLQAAETASATDVIDEAIPFFSRNRDYAAFWAKNREVTDLFRGNRLSCEDRERFWARTGSGIRLVRRRGPSAATAVRTSRPSSSARSCRRMPR